MTPDMQIPEAAVRAARQAVTDFWTAYVGVPNRDVFGAVMHAALQAAFAEALVPVGCVSDAAMERLRTVPDTWDDIFTLDGDTSDMTTLYTIKETP